MDWGGDRGDLEFPDVGGSLGSRLGPIRPPKTIDLLTCPQKNNWKTSIFSEVKKIQLHKKKNTYT